MPLWRLARALPAPRVGLPTWSCLARALHGGGEHGTMVRRSMSRVAGAHDTTATATAPLLFEHPLPTPSTQVSAASSANSTAALLPKDGSPSVTPPKKSKRKSPFTLTDPAPAAEPAAAATPPAAAAPQPAAEPAPKPRRKATTNTVQAAPATSQPATAEPAKRKRAAKAADLEAPTSMAAPPTGKEPHVPVPAPAQNVAPAVAPATAAAPSVAANLGVPMNECGIQLLPEYLRCQLFGDTRAPLQHRAEMEQHLNTFKLFGRSVPPAKDPPPFTIPGMEGRDVREHFMNIAKKQSEPYGAMARKFVQTMHAAKGLPPMPATWALQPGWTRYCNGTATSVPHPLEDTLVFDVETCVRDSDYPVMAVAASTTAWYAWVPQRLIDAVRGKKILANPDMISLATPTDPRLVIGHFVGYDRQRVLDEYRLAGTRTAFLDTASLHMITAGFSSQQRASWHLGRAERVQDTNQADDDWVAHTAPASLADCYELWCKKALDKSARNILVTEPLETVAAEFQSLMTYCAKDVLATAEIFALAFPEFEDFCPHPATLAGMLEMGRSYLPVNQTWTEYIAAARAAYESNRRDIHGVLRALVHDALKLTPLTERDMWMSQLDWTVVPVKYTKKGVPYKRQHLPGMPAWYRGLHVGGEDEIDISLRTVLTPLLMRMEWVAKGEDGVERAFPLFHHKKHKWGYLVPLSVPHTGTGPIVDESVPAGHALFKLPHKDGEEANCGSPLSKDYLRYLDAGVLRAAEPRARSLLEKNVECSYWLSAHDRIESQFVVWDRERGLKPTDFVAMAPLGATPAAAAAAAGPGSSLPAVDGGLGAILPRLVVSGTVTRRAVEATWLTASNPKKNRIGSELKSKVRVPPGYRFVGADVDSQELWIAAVLGDSHFHAHGATALGWMTLQGTKSDGTDMHSHTANILGISRDQAKIVNYARIYGSGKQHATNLLQQFNPRMGVAEAQQRAEDLYCKTKGVRNSTRQPWAGGTESYMFNVLESIATQPIPKTPVLGCRISNGLQPNRLTKKTQFMTSRVNWVVQSSAVDFLHLLLVAMRHFCEIGGIKARFAISIHDEVRYIVAEEDADRAAFALHLSNLLVRSMFAQELGFSNLPRSVAFFSAVDVDHCLRKEVTLPCTTPSNTVAEADGRSLDIFGAGASSGWSLDRPATTATATKP
eukprot:m.238770 g.238770  ORF g.238770 m.238770 type:complete len:1172 (+) comp13360_c0_seq1:44-3559(+)